MSDPKQSKQLSEADAQLEREIRKGRKFTLEEAIARMAGPGAMKGESPVTRKEQAEAEIDNFLRRHLIDASGTLPLVLFRRVKNSEILLENFDQPLVVLARYTQQVLDSEYLLTEVVREADAHWGGVLGERPYFEKEGSPPHPDDPYTIETVRITLSQLVEELTVGDPYDNRPG